MHVLYSFPHPLGGPGIGTTAWHEVDALARAGARVTVVCGRLARGFDPALGVRTVVTLGPVRPRLVGAARAYRWHDRLAAAVVRRARPDVVHTWPRAVLQAAGAAQRSGAVSIRSAPSPYTRVAVDRARRAWEELGVDLPPRHFHGLDEAALAREDAEFAAVDGILCGSDEAARTFDGTGFEPRVRVSPYGYDTELFPDPPAREPDGPVQLVFVGRCEPAKGIHVLLRAWQRADVPPGARLVLCGSLDPRVAAALGALLGQPGVEHRGFVGDIAPVLRASHALVLPSYSEGSALAGYEALGAGIVPLVSDASGTPVAHERTGLVHPVGDVDTLVSHLQRVLGDPAERLRLRAGVLAERGRWTWPACGPRLVRAYEETRDRQRP